MARLAVPFPPLELAHRVGSLEQSSDPLEYYDQLGYETRRGIVERLPAEWTFAGKRVLDFGCGAGRTLRHFLDEGREADMWGCDIDEASVRWMSEHLSPPFHVFVNGPEPPIDQPDSSFDLIWAISVFSHLASNWAPWLTELHRLLKPEGLLLATFMGRGMSEVIAQEPWDEDRFGMNIIKFGQSWDLGGPMVIHAPWWIEEHWGRVFEFLSISPDGFASKPWLDHGTAIMRKREVAVDPEILQAPAAGHPRETSALSHNVKQLLAECLELRDGLHYVDSKLAETIRQKEALEAEGPELDRMRDEVERIRAEAVALHRSTALAEAQAAVARERSLRSAERVLQVEESVAQSGARVYALEEAVEDLEEQHRGASEILAAMRASVSWRITAPLRAVKRLVR